MIRYNTKTTATSDMKDSEFNKLPADVQKRWREASESEIKIHDKRVADQKILDKKTKERTKEKEKSDKKKAELRSSAEGTPPADTTSTGEGSTDKAESEEPK